LKTIFYCPKEAKWPKKNARGAPKAKKCPETSFGQPEIVFGKLEKLFGQSEMIF
jgi:hypothetical protein